MSTSVSPLSLRKVSTSTAASFPTSAVPPSYRESLLASYPYAYCNQHTCCTNALPNSYLDPRPAPPIPPKAAARFNQDPKRDLQDLESCIARISAHHNIDAKTSELYHSTSLRRKHQFSRPSKRVIFLLLLNAAAITTIAVAGYIGTTSRTTARSSAFWFDFTNALPKSLISAAFVFGIAVFGLTPCAQRLLSGRFWTQL